MIGPFVAAVVVFFTAGGGSGDSVRPFHQTEEDFTNHRFLETRSVWAQWPAGLSCGLGEAPTKGHTVCRALYSRILQPEPHDQKRYRMRLSYRSAVHTIRLLPTSDVPPNARNMTPPAPYIFGGSQTSLLAVVSPPPPGPPLPGLPSPKYALPENTSSSSSFISPKSSTMLRGSPG